MRGRRWLAALLSSIVPGTGQLFNGEWRKWLGVTALLLGGLPLLLAAVVRLHVPALRVGGLVVFGLGLIVLYAWSARDAFARAQGADRPAYRGVHRALPAMLLVLLLVQPALRRWFQRHVAEGFTVSAASMHPTLRPGDYFFAGPLRESDLRVGQIVVHASRMDPGTSVVLRLVALPGDTIEMKAASLYRNGRRLEEPYLDSDHGPDVPLPREGLLSYAWHLRALTGSTVPESYRPSRDSWGPLVVPDSQYFTLGDDRDGSLDSRFLGFVPRDALQKRPLWIYFSWDRVRGAPRWSRVGGSLR